MRIMIASDIHGSEFYCKKMLDAFYRENADRLLLLGDILYHGPRNELTKDYNTKEVIKMLNGIKNKIFCVRGNCDGEVDQMVLEFPILADYCILPVEDRLIYVTHGHKYNMDSLPPLQAGDILLHGHTHIPSWTEFGENNLYLNPGSVSIPKNDSYNSYMLLDNLDCIWKDLEGNEYHTIRI